MIPRSMPSMAGTFGSWGAVAGWGGPLPMTVHHGVYSGPSYGGLSAFKVRTKEQALYMAQQAYQDGSAEVARTSPVNAGGLNFAATQVRTTYATASIAQVFQGVAARLKSAGASKTEALVRSMAYEYWTNVEKAGMSGTADPTVSAGGAAAGGAGWMDTLAQALGLGQQAASIYSTIRAPAASSTTALAPSTTPSLYTPPPTSSGTSTGKVILYVGIGLGGVVALVFLAKALSGRKAAAA